MLSERQLILNHDWQIFKAKFMLAGHFEMVEKDFISLCEAGCLEALSIYSASYDSGVNDKIDSIIDTYPDKSKEEIIADRMAGRATDEDMFKVVIKNNRATRHLVSDMSADDWMVQTLIAHAKAVGYQTNESFSRELQKIKEKGVSDEVDNKCIALIASILSHGQDLKGPAFLTLTAIANQPYSQIVQGYLDENTSGDESSPQ